jgi:hypothetical protein
MAKGATVARMRGCRRSIEEPVSASNGRCVLRAPRRRNNEIIEVSRRLGRDNLGRDA